MKHVFEFDNAIGIGRIEGRVLRDVPSFMIMFGVIVRWIGLKKFRWYRFQCTIRRFHWRGWTVFDTVAVFGLKSAAIATRRIGRCWNKFLASPSKKDHT